MIQTIYGGRIIGATIRLRQILGEAARWLPSSALWLRACGSVASDYAAGR